MSLLHVRGVLQGPPSDDRIDDIHDKHKQKTAMMIAFASRIATYRLIR